MMDSYIVDVRDVRVTVFDLRAPRSHVVMGEGGCFFWKSSSGRMGCGCCTLVDGSGEHDWEQNGTILGRARIIFHGLRAGREIFEGIIEDRREELIDIVILHNMTKNTLIS